MNDTMMVKNIQRLVATILVFLCSYCTAIFSGSPASGTSFSFDPTNGKNRAYSNDKWKAPTASNFTIQFKAKASSSICILLKNIVNTAFVSYDQPGLYYLVQISTTTAALTLRSGQNKLTLSATQNLKLTSNQIESWWISVENDKVVTIGKGTVAGQGQMVTWHVPKKFVISGLQYFSLGGTDSITNYSDIFSSTLVALVLAPPDNPKTPVDTPQKRWVLDKGGHVWHREGYSTGKPTGTAWILVGTELFEHLVVSPIGRIWVLAKTNDDPNDCVVKVRANVSADSKGGFGSQVGTGWVSCDRTPMAKFVLLGEDVWGINKSGLVFFRSEISQTDATSYGAGWINVSTNFTPATNPVSIQIINNQVAVTDINKKNWLRVGTAPGSMGTEWR